MYLYSSHSLQVNRHARLFKDKQSLIKVTDHCTSTQASENTHSSYQSTDTNNQAMGPITCSHSSDQFNCPYQIPTSTVRGEHVWRVSTVMQMRCMVNVIEAKASL